MDTRTPRVQRRLWLAGTVLTAVGAVVMAAFSTLANSAAVGDASACAAVLANDRGHGFAESAGVQVASRDGSGRLQQ